MNTEKKITKFYYHRLHGDDIDSSSSFFFSLFKFKWNWKIPQTMKWSSKRNWMDRSPKKHWMTFLGRQRLLYTTHENDTPKIFFLLSPSGFTHLCLFVNVWVAASVLRCAAYFDIHTQAHRHTVNVADHAQLKDSAAVAAAAAAAAATATKTNETSTK